MTLRAALTVLCVLLVGACSAFADSVPTSYVINFNVSDSTGIFSIGPGHFSFDSQDQKNTIIQMPALPDFLVPASLNVGAPCSPTTECSSPFTFTFIISSPDVIFTQTSQDDDSLQLDQNGLVSGLNVDSTVPFAPNTVNVCPNTVALSCGLGEATLQLKLDGSWILDINTIDANGTYTVSPVPEPSTLGFLAAAVLGIAARRRRVCR